MYDPHLTKSDHIMIISPFSTVCSGKIKIILLELYRDKYFGGKLLCRLISKQTDTHLTNLAIK